MKVKIKRKFVLIYIAVFIIVLSESLFFMHRNLGHILEYVGYLMLLGQILISFYHVENNYQKKYFSFFVVIVTLMSLGFWVLDLALIRKIVLFFTVLGISISAVLSKNYITSLDLLRSISYCAFFSILIAAMLAIIGGDSIVDHVDPSTTGVLGIQMGFNGGMTYKNYFAADMLAIFMGIYFYYKCEKKKSKDLFVLVLLSIMILASNSKGGILLLVIFLVSMNYSILKKIPRKQRKIFVYFISIIFCIAIINIYSTIILNVSTYGYRYRGLINYIGYFESDWYRIILGSADLMYDQEEEYVVTVRSITGWDGSLEMAWLNILIKSGLLGIVAYFLLYIRYLKNILQIEDWNYKTCMLSVWVTLLASSFVEAYIQSVHCFFAIFCYLLICGLGGRKEKHQIIRNGGY